MNISWFTEKLTHMDIPTSIAYGMTITVFFLLVAITATAAGWFVRILLQKYVLQWIAANRYQWDDPLIKTRFFSRISWFVPLAIFAIAIDTFLQKETTAHLLSKRLMLSGFVVVSVLSLNAFLTAVKEIDHLVRKTSRSTLQGYIDAAKIVIYLLGGIFIISIFSGQSPWGILSVLGGLTAITLLVFKDTILGFVASIQLSSMDMLRRGDWIEMEQYGADGDVLSISIHSVKVQNFDKTITTIPTYALVSSSFKNWRGMTESRGRRIKRALHIDIASIQFCTEEMVSRFSNIDILQDYIAAKEQEIADHNTKTKNIHILNGRRQTNIGVFRQYVMSYLEANTNIHKKMTFLVRQLAPTDHGLPLEIYVFSKDKNWVNYESIQADIFDHLLAAASEFDLRVFQNPTGYDYQHMTMIEPVK